MKTKCKVIVLSSVVILIGCRTIKEKEVTHEIYRDSIRYVERVKIDTLKIKGDTVSVFVDCNDPKPKPQTRRSGRSSVIVEPTEKGYLVTAVCDSLERLVVSYEKTLYTLRTAHQRESKLKSVGLSGWQTFQIWAGRLLLLFLVGYFVLKRYVA